MTPNYYDVDHHDATLKGRVTFHTPTQLETIRIEARKAQLAQPVRVDDLTATGQNLAHIVATLEFVIDTAPSGFYSTDARGRLMLDPGNILMQEVVWAVYGAWREFTSGFLARSRGAEEAPRDGGAVASGESSEPRPADEPGVDGATVG